MSTSDEWAKVQARLRFERLYYQPDGPTAWLPARLEYQFAVSAPVPLGEKVLLAEEYFQGHLDWYNFDVDPSGTPLGALDPAAVQPTPHTLAMIPTQVTFNGMPNSRWWRFEDSRTNFGDIKPDTTDLAKLLLIEFGLVFVNDWYVVPFTIPAGSIADVHGLAVTNVFGEKTWVSPAGTGDDEDWQRWSMFLLSTKGEAHVPADLSLVVPPAARQVLEWASAHRPSRTECGAPWAPSAICQFSQGPHPRSGRQWLNRRVVKRRV